ncbi:hypothetical protein EC912_108137 [Luteibacter rhizovicinus]|uniref:Mitochondrial fission protein ELM1 n=1 Tax=Luteibacter rhizovicinus TaxID=242606 RepID=A0A4R3YMT3_9GAMM|nr:mitochondrial fission ELM1 family protein [Luteibacter rhizovicinus]TCV92143.1 hypothetical protein EC912_108137 [Luteibacter rhizovicinus]
MTIPGECWVVTDGAAGNRRQALALAEALKMPVRELIVTLRAPWSWFAPRMLPGVDIACRRDGSGFSPPWPPIVIGCGRASALLTRRLRARSEGRTFAVQILDPHISPRHWDMVVAPRHDGLEGPNVLTPIGSLNPVDDAWLDDGREAFAYLTDLKGPRLAVLLGGPRRGMPFDGPAIAGFVDAVTRRHILDGGSVMAVASRRTPPDAIAALREALDGVPGFIWANEGDGPNPYPGVLGWADRFLVTPDSVNMLSEACATGRPVHTMTHGTLPSRIARFHRELRESGRLHDVGAVTPASQPALRETEAIAATVRTNLRTRHGATPR